MAKKEETKPKKTPADHERGGLVTRDYKTTLETREENEQGIIEGRPIVYGEYADIGGYFREIIMPGALDRTDLTDVRLCLNHDTGYVYARSRNNTANNTMQLFTDEQGLRIRANLAINTSPKAKDYYSAIHRGDMDKMSFMFAIEDEEWDDLDTDYPTRKILRIATVVEVSAVTFPAYEATNINARDKAALENARQTLESAKRSNANGLESTGNTLELEKAKFDFLTKFKGV